MEAEAKHSFQASEEDELSFQKNDVLKVSLYNLENVYGAVTY